ncbi:MAG: helix-turn-helix domain-containing protein [Acidiferrobacteraceae bacterium]
MIATLVPLVEMNISSGERPCLLGVWEQHRRKPAGPARALLRVLEVNPKAVIKALHRTAA